MRFSKITVAWGIYIVISAAFIQQVRNWLFLILGDYIMTRTIKMGFFVLGFLYVFYALKKRFSLFRVIIAIAIFILAYFFSVWQPYFSERTHVLTYGFLGYSATQDIWCRERNLKIGNIFLILGFVGLISGLDEIFQHFLPYRVGDFRDFITNIISGAFGAALLLLFKIKKL